MDFNKAYNNLIKQYKNKYIKKFSKYDTNYIYLEEHHIIPKSLGGSNNKENKILLPARVHFIAHLLLANMYNKGSKEEFMMQRAVIFLSGRSSNSNMIIKSSRIYKKIKEEYSIEFGKRSKIINSKPKSEEWKRKHSLRITGSGNPMYGKCGINNPKFGMKYKLDNKCSESQLKLYNSGYINPRKGIKLSNETKLKMSLAKKGKSLIFTEKGKLLHAKKMANKVWINLENKEQKYIEKEELSKYLLLGWKTGMIKGRTWNKDSKEKLSDSTKGRRLINGKWIKTN